MEPPPEAAGRRGGGPYKGLDSFAEEDWRLFFGRDRERDVIATNLRARRVTVLYGPSGVGKSSLLRAGVVHHLRLIAERNVAEVGVPEFVPLVVSDWREEPLATIRRALADAVVAFADEGQEPSGSLGEVIQQYSALVGSRMLIVLDQLEEYFLYHGPPAGPDPLTAELAEILTRPQLRASFLLSIRDDALAKLDPLRKRVPGLFNTVLHLEPLDRIDAEAAIVLPLSRYDGVGPRAAEPAFVEGLLDELSGDTPVPEQGGQGRIGPHDERIDPSYLQMVLSTLWAREPDDHVLRRGTLDDLGGAEAIARRHLDEALDALPTRERDLAAEALRFLVTPLGAKIALAAEELQSFTGEDIGSTLEQLAGSSRVLRTVSSVSGQDQPTRYEIFHDVLGPAVLDWRARYVRDRDRHELERQAAEERERARVERRRARVFQALALVALAGLVAALVAFAVALREKASADRQRRAAESRAMAANAIELLPTRLDDGVTRALAARDRTNTFEARRALLVASRATDGLVRFLRFGHRVTALAADRDDGFDIALETGALVTVDRNGRRAGGWNGEQRTLTAVAHDPRRSRVAVGGQDSVEFLDERRVAGRVEFRRTTATQVGFTVRAIAFDSSGRHFAAGGDGGIVVWRLDDRGRRVGAVRKPFKAETTSLSFEHDDALVVGTASGRRLRFELMGPKRPPTMAPATSDLRFPDRIDPPVRIAADPRARYVAGADAVGRVGLWEEAPGVSFVRFFFGQGDESVGLAFDESGTRLAAASRDGTVAVWAIAPSMPHLAVKDAAPVTGDAVAVVSPTGALDLRSADGASTRRIGSDAEHVSASANGRRFVSAGTAGVLAADRDGSHVVHFARGVHLRDVAIANDGTVAGILGADARVALWRGGRPERIAQPPQSLSGASATVVSISPDGSRVAVGYFTGEVVLWAGGHTTIVRRGTSPVTALAFDAKGSALAIGDDDGGVEIRNLSGASAIRIVAHASTVNGLGFSRDGRMLVSGGDDGVVRLWDAESGGRLDELLGHGRAVTRAGFGPDGRTLVVARGSLAVWRTDTWRLDSEPSRKHLCSLIDDVDRPVPTACS